MTCALKIVSLSSSRVIQWILFRVFVVRKKKTLYFNIVTH